MKKFAKSIPLGLVPWIITALASLAIIGTYTLLSHTYDEPAHVAAGLEWWMKGAYTLEPMHPPLARLMTALLPFLAFDKTILTQAMGTGDYIFDAGWGVFKSPEIDYWKLVFLSRLGVLPFYIASCVALFFWARRAAGLQAACWSMVLYATLPMVAGNAGLATTDMPATAMLFISLYTCMQWLENPTSKIAAYAGVSIGLMICCKFSNLLLFPAAFAPMVALWLWRNRFSTVTKQHWISGFLIITPLMIFVVFALHFFSLETIQKGIEQVLGKNARGHAIWLFGPLDNHGVWYYFPVLFFVKTPLPFIALVCASFTHLRKLPVEIIYPLAAALGVFTVCAFSDINIGLRHVLVVYPLFAIAAGYMLQRLWQAGYRHFCWLLVALQCVSFAQAYPDLFSYFNILARGKPEQISTGPDVDWGQDVALLEKAIRKFEIDRITFCNFYTRDSLALSLLSVPIEGCVNNKDDAKGWFVISRVRPALDEGFAWLGNHTPVEEVGASYLLYYFK